MMIELTGVGFQRLFILSLPIHICLNELSHRMLFFGQKNNMNQMRNRIFYLSQLNL
jgi:hypothetical protein